MKAELNLLVILGLLVTSCGLRPSQPTSLSQESPAISSKEPETDLGITDDSGAASLEDPITGKDYSFRVQDTETREGLENIEVLVSNNGSGAFVFVNDPSGQYFPVAYELESLTTAGSWKLARGKNQVVEILILLTIASAIQTVQDLWELYNDPPRLENSGFIYDEYCWNPDQMELEFGLLSEVGKFFLPFLGVKDDLLMTDLIQLQLGEEASDWLRDFNGIARWRYYHITPLGIPAVVRNGFCLEPLDKKDPDSMREWIVYGLEHNDLFPFERLMERGFGFFDYPGMGGQYVTREEALKEFGERIKSNVSCVGYRFDRSDWGSILEFYTTGWENPWEITAYSNGMLPFSDEPSWSTFAGFDDIGNATHIDTPSESSEVGFIVVEIDGDYKFLSIMLYENSDFPSMGCDQPLENSNSDALEMEDILGQGTELSCPGAPAQRLEIGETARICTKADRITLRSGPGRSYDGLQLYEPGTILNVIGGPSCADSWSWWQVTAPNGLTGWMTEGGDEQDPYYLCPGP